MSSSIYKDETNSLLEVTSFEVIRQHEESIGNAPTGLYFNKLMSLTYTELLEKRNINIKLPHCWYRYGDEVVRYLMPNEVRWNHETPLYTSVSWEGREPQYEGASVETIKEVVERYTEKYKALTKEQLVDDVYSLAPLDFQRNFRQLRLNIETIMSASVKISNFKEAVLLPSLDGIIKSFPENEFPQEVVERVRNYEMLMRKLIELPAFSYEIAKEITEDVWFYFCYYLRVHKNCYDNIPRNVIEYWESQLEDQKGKFDRIFSEILLSLNEKHGIELDGKLQEILNQRKKEKEEELQFLEEFLKE